MTDVNTPPLAAAERRLSEFRDTFAHVRAEIGRIYVGHDTLVEQALIGFFAGGHVLIEGAPGLGKTLLVRTIADTLRLDYARVQCTPDLLPGDVTGTNILGDDRRFTFHRGPIFANVVLADEINRATPRTQSAFLEAMQERHVTVFGTTHDIPAPFSVFATQNPIEMEGTYPLPEAQLDRFVFKLFVPAPTVAELAEIVTRTTGPAAATPATGVDAATVTRMQALVRDVPIAADVLAGALRLVRATHPDADEAPMRVRKYVRYGASPRAAQALVLGAKALALVRGRVHVATEDITAVALPALRHRILLNFQAELDRITADALVGDILAG